MVILIKIPFVVWVSRKWSLKSGLHKPQLPVDTSVTLVSSIVVEQLRCALQVSSIARLQENKEMNK